MASLWKTRNEQRAPSSAETEQLLPDSPEFYTGCDEMQQVLHAYQEVGAHISLDTPVLKLSGLNRLFKRFRPASSDSDKAITSVADDGTRPRAQHSNEAVTNIDYATSSPRHYPSDAVWVTSASHPGPFSPPPTDDQGQPLTGSRTQAFSTGYLSDLSLHSTPLTSGTLPAGRSGTNVHKMSLTGTTPLTAQELHDSTLSALSETSSSPVKSPTEKKIPKKKPTGTFEYTVQEGDTLVKIGAHFEVTPSELMKINKLVSRMVFVGQTLFVPDPNHVPSDPPTPTSASPDHDTRPKMDIPLASLPSVPGHAVQITSPTTPAKVATVQTASFQQKKQVEEEEPDKECLQKFLKMPVRRVMEDDEEVTASEGFTVKGTLLVTPNAVMFDPDVNDKIVISKDGHLKFSVVVYMEEIKSVALFHDISPRMFWKQPKELLDDSPKQETYHSGQGKRPNVEGHAETQEEMESASSTRLTPDGASVGGDSGQHRASPDGRDATNESQGCSVTGRTSEELEHMAEMSADISDLNAQPGRASKEVEHALTSSMGCMPSSPVVKQMSRSSELEVCEISQLHHAADVCGETRDFGPHMGRSSSEVHRQTSSALGRISVASPGDFGGHSFLTERSDSTSDNLNTPTQGFAPVHFTDRSPMTVTTHPKAVSGQRLMVLSQPPVTTTDLKSQENRIAEDTEVGASDLHLGGQSDVSTGTDDQLSHGKRDSLSNFSVISTHSAQDLTQSVSKSQTSTAVQIPGGDVSARSHAGDVKPVSSEGETGLDGTLTASKEVSVVDTLASYIADLTLGTTNDKKDELEDDSTKPKDGSPRLPFSPLRTPAQHISSFFNYTSSFFRSTTASDKEDSASTPPAAGSDGKGKYASLPSSPPYKLQLKSEFTKADISRALGPDPKEFLPRSDSHHFEEAPLYLQIRPGVQKDKEVHQPRAFDHRNVSPLQEQYWFVVPRDMGDKLYTFLMEWQPDAYGDEEERRPRERFFFDERKVEGVSQLVRTGHEAPSSKAGGDGPQGMLHLSDDQFNETEKTWEILSKEEVYRAEKEQALYREDTVDESNFPELIGPTVIIKEEHIRALMRSLPRNMSVGYNWELLYATHKHGYSLHNLYMRTEDVENDSPVLLFIMDTYGSVFGAYLSNTIRPHDTFYGSGATFLFTFYPTFKKFSWQGENHFFMHGTKDFFAVGSGEGLFGLWLDGDLDKGRSRECTTFHNDVLARDEDFSILQLEVWKFVDSSLL